MKRAYIYILLSILIPASLHARNVETIEMNHIEDAAMNKDGSRLIVEIPLNLSDIKAESRRAVTLTPVVTDGCDSLKLPMVALYGRDRWIHYRRDLGDNMLAGKEGYNIRAWKAPETFDYKASAEWQGWMENASLIIVRKDYGCCSHILAEGTSTPLFKLMPPEENVTLDFEYAFVSPVAEPVKHRAAEGRAFIDFPVNQTIIYSDYRNNAVELAKIIATIDSIRSDKDINVKSISIKGFASPEGSWANNSRLAQGRTAALKEYVQNLYKFAPGFIKTSYEPEDWKGLRDWLENSTLSARDGILTIVDSDLEPDIKDARIKKLYPQDYAFILKNVYPALRHSDYRIDFEIKSFTDVEEIKRLVRTQPQKLSLNEFYLAAQSYAPGSDDFNEVFETAVRMYPDDEIANLNAANAAIGRKDFDRAERFLTKAGDSGNTEYVWGLLEISRENYEKAMTHMQNAAKLKVANANAVISQLKKKIK